MHLVERNCIPISSDGTDRASSADPRPLSEYRDLPAYVLIGNPGAGKTTAFEQECAALADGGEMVLARDFLTFEDRPEWHGKVLFIDGLDEIRAGAQDARTPLDVVRARLEKLGRPRFRLSCRSADWLDALDRNRLAMVAQGGKVQVLCLKPLAEADILQILEHDPQVEDATEFTRQAEQRGLSELLTNPQTLDLLAKAVAAGAWPETRRETFELACRKLIGERNSRHQNVTALRHTSLERNLHAAGFLCAIQIIAGKAGYALTENVATEDFPWLGELSGEDDKLFPLVVRTRLFSGSGVVAPIHRHIAEYLAARCISDCIDRRHLPVGRILASITGVDGIAVSQLRGLSAWLATLCVSWRDFIIDRDPVGVALYGDTKDFSVNSKSRLLKGLGQHMKAHHSLFWSSSTLESSLGALATPDMKDRLREILLTTDRSDRQQEVAGCVLDAMRYGADFPDLRGTLLQVIRDSSWHLHLRVIALKLLLHHWKGPARDREAKMLTEDIRNGKVADSRGDLMGLLLYDLYPDAIPFPEILNYLYVPHCLSGVPAYAFQETYYTSSWEHLISIFPPEGIFSLLDQVSAKAEVFLPVLNHLSPGWCVRLAMKGLQEHGEAISLDRLHRWLGIVPDKHGMLAGRLEFSQIQEWLQARPDIQVGLLDKYFDQCSREKDFESCMTKAKSLLFKQWCPPAFSRWCLKKLPKADGGQIFRYLAEQAIFCRRDHDISLLRTEIEGTAKKDPKRTEVLNEIFHGIKLDTERRRVQVARQDAEAKERLKSAKSSETALREGNVPLGLLYHLGQAYLGREAVARGFMPEERLENFLCHDQVLTHAAVEGLRRSVNHPQMPSVEDIVQLHIDNKIHLLGPPVLAGLELNSEAVPNAGQDIRDGHLRQACAFHLTGGENLFPAWYSALVKTRPELVADVLQTCAGALLKHNRKGYQTLEASIRELAHDDDWARVAQISAMAMLRAFPVRASKRQLVWLNALLQAALRHSSQADFLALIRRKAKLGSMNVGTRIRWLAAGVLARPEEFLQKLADFVNAAEKRVGHLADFCSTISTEQFLSTPTIELLFRKIGEFYVPYKGLRKVRGTPAEEASSFLYRLRSELDSRPTAEAAAALARLLAEPKLGAWQSELQAARANQRAVWREAEFRHLDVCRANRLLNNQQPANADDLKALTEVVLQEVSHRIRNGDTDDYRQYWNEGPHRKLEKPKHEEACRDALVSDLQQSLARFGVEPEKHLADDARADVMVTFGGAHGFAMPIEIKKNTSDDLWSAMRDQLIAKYVRDPRAGGCGLYVVFWFGADRKQPPPSQGAWPRSAAELEARLQETLLEEEARKIAVCVVDVAAPEQAKSTEP